jgi:CRP-like cAMP-binding protein
MKVQDTEILRRSSVFRFVADEHFAAIEPLLQEEHYDFGDVIVKQDDPADSFYVLTKGRARALKIKPDGEEIPLGVLKPGDSFGEAEMRPCAAAQRSMFYGSIATTFCSLSAVYPS